MDRALFDKVQEYADETGLPISVIIAKALKQYFEEKMKENSI